MASNPGQIPVGDKEKISVVVNTRNRGGTSLHKGFTVFTNDPSRQRVRLEIIGKVKGYVTVAPAYVRLTGPAGQAISRSVRVIPREGYPFKIKKIQAQQDKYLQYRLQPLADRAGEEGYRLMVENTRSEAGTYHDTIIIETDSRHKPTLRIPVYGRIFDPEPGKGGKSSK